MSAIGGRSALDPRMSLFDHVSRLHARAPDLPLPGGGHPYPDDADHWDRPYGDEEADHAVLLTTVREFFADGTRPVERLHDDLRDLLVRAEHAANLAWPADPPWPTPDRARTTGLWLVRNSTDRVPALVGLFLLTGTARPEDMSSIKVLGLLSCFTPAVVQVLRAIPGSPDALIWLVERSRIGGRSEALRALCRLRDPSTFPWLLRRAVDDRVPARMLAKEIADAVDLAELLQEADDPVITQGGVLLAALADDPLEDQYPELPRAVAGFSRRASGATRSLDLLATAITLTEELRTGRLACLDWPERERATTLARFLDLLSSPSWDPVLAEASHSPQPLTRGRADWARWGRERALTSTPVRPQAGVHSRLAVGVVVPDPASYREVQTRLLVDDRPLIAEAFPLGVPGTPETLLRELPARSQAREVRLAGVACDEGCCGALYVTIVLDGDTVIWRDWRNPREKVGLPELRFAARPYAMVIEEALRDDRWEWPARTLAGRLNRLIRDENLLGPWNCEPGGVCARAHARDRMEVIFWHPREPGDEDDEPWLQLEWIVPVRDGEDPEAQLVRIASHLRGVDPRDYATVIAGAEADAYRLGFPWPDP
ncbi:hypothetical protein [Rhizohabitans arisaemae]|uniref:hypothetical protein n=1 Tax=Rhizohabitans arisaemae TaxID=2720610 RepID=UPI0024B03CD2|nr:hypothetical protein [Rhizohabitans arisaemae]